MLLQPARGGAAGRQRLDSAGTAGESSGGRLVVRSGGEGKMRETPAPRWLCFPAPEARAAPQRCLPVCICALISMHLWRPLPQNNTRVRKLICKC